MAAVSKAKFGRSLKARLDALSCPYSQETEEDWIVELVFKPGEPRIRLLQWLFSKYDSALGEMVDNSQTAIMGSRMDSRMQRLLFVASNLGLCRYDDVDLIRGVESSSTSIFNKQVKFMDRLLDIVTIRDTAEDPMTKSLLHAGVISDSSSLEEQVAADRRLMDALVSKQLPHTMLTHSEDLIPHDIRRLMQQSAKDGSGDVPTLYKLTEMCSNIERNLSRRLEILEGMQDVKNEDSSRLYRASHSLKLVLGDLSQLVVSFSYTYENEMLPWCHRAPQHFSQLGPAFKRVHALITKFAQMLQGLHQIRQSHQCLREGVENKLKVTDTTRSAILVEIGQAAVTSFQDCVDILENSVQQEQPSLPLTSGLWSAKLRM